MGAVLDEHSGAARVLEVEVRLDVLQRPLHVAWRGVHQLKFIKT